MPRHHQLSLDQSQTRRCLSRGIFLSTRWLLAIVSIVTVLLVAIVVISSGQSGNAHCLQERRSNSEQHGDASVDSMRTKTVTGLRLPSHIKPLSYQLKLLPIIEEGNFTMTGRVKIRFRAQKRAKNITLHIKKLTVNESLVRVQELVTDKTIGVRNFVYDLEREFLVLKLRKKLLSGHEYELIIPFVGIVGAGLSGFYRSSYRDANGRTKWLGVTHFEPADARKAFPCFDEPHLKAVFNITLGRKSHWISVSNMPLVETKPIEGMADYEWDVFEPTVPMSTYLVAFLVSEFDRIEAPVVGNATKFSIYARKEAIDQATYAMEIGPKILTYYEDLFKIQYPLPKQDMVAIPDFQSGAMENWGLVTYREQALLFKKGISSQHDKQLVAIIIAHELAHQWFGNLVTPHWWSDLWLNEGFASYVENLGTDYVEPQWKIMEQFVTTIMHNAFSVDSLETTRPISIDVNHPDEVGQLFDVISYQKGASIIRMMEHFLKKETFYRGLTIYLSKHKYSSATTNDLWQAMTAQAQKDGTIPSELTVSKIMNTWTLRKGFPVVLVTRNYETGSVTLTQSRFLLNDDHRTDDSSWWIPLTYSVDNSPDFANTQTKLWMGTKKQIIQDLTEPDSWVIFNNQEIGFYKVNYDLRNWQMIVQQLKTDHSVVHTINRAQLIDDSMDLARAGQLNYNTVFDILGYVEKENEFIPWQAAVTNLNYITVQLQRSPIYGDLVKFLLSLIEKQYTSLGFDDSDNDTQLMSFHRSIIVESACNIGHRPCVRQSVQLFDDYMKQPEVNPIQASKRKMVYCVGVREGDERHWEFGWQQYMQAELASEQITWLNALSCSRHTWLLNRYMDLIWPAVSITTTAANTTDNSIASGGGGGEAGPAPIRQQNGINVLKHVTHNVLGHELVVRFLDRHWQQLVAYFGVRQLSSLLSTLSASCNDRWQLEWLRHFRRQHWRQLGTGNRDLEHALEQMANNIEWMDKNFHTIRRWLERHNNNNNSNNSDNNNNNSNNNTNNNNSDNNSNDSDKNNS